MKQFFISICLAMALSIGLPLASFAKKNITILYTGDIEGHITAMRG
ncbi:Uncharacterized protein dnm_004920 [Desulfonema magnum]|uniref:Uncharacterized protein n=1 Tax=Desulfonema magnum TaxID=45655 RepID=A0A975GKG5_9BACT|nr:Uncharacterized protein dnm_004920 [Desulfonema magnum]